MSTLSGHVADYLRLRRALGYKLERAGHLLPKLVAYLEAAGSPTLTSELAICWARLPAQACPNHWAARLAVARGFARYLQTIEPATQVPPTGVFPSRRYRPAPYLWSQRDICRLLDSARTLRSPLRAATYEALFGLLAVSGMRVGEAVGLDRDDIDFQTGVITIREAKFDRTRLVPLHETTTAALRAYATERDRLCPAARSVAFFVSSAGTRLNRSDVAKTLRRITTAMGLRNATLRPTAHQLRHSFAVRTLIDWQRSGVSVDEHIAPVDLPGPHRSRRHVLVSIGVPRTHGHGRRAARLALRSPAMTALAPALQAYFTDRLIGQRAASPNTIAAYKVTFRLLLGFASQRTGRTPSALDIADLDAPLVAAFLDHLEADRHNGPATRNNRLAAVHSLFAYLALHHPEHAGSIQRVLAIPTKRTERNLVTYLTEAEVNALLQACDHSTWTGRRDHAMFALTIQTGLRISELASLTCQDVTLTAGANVHTIGKGRKERRTPLVPTTRAILKAWLTERAGGPCDPLFPTTTGRHPSRDAIERRLTRTVTLAGESCPSIQAKRVSMHTLRHTAAMRLLLAGNDITVIALWLGHEQIATTNIYLHADMTQKQKAIDRTRPTATRQGRYRPPDPLIAFLESL